LAKYYRKTIPYVIENYIPDCGRPYTHVSNTSYRGQVRVFCYRLTDIRQLTTGRHGSVLYELLKHRFDQSVGVYFYRLANDDSPFIKIGECSSRPITERFRRGWDLNGVRNTDSYIYRQTKNSTTDKQKHKPLYRALRTISSKSPAYFTFYEMVTEEAAPKADEFVAVEKHIQHFGTSTVSPHRLPNYPTGVELVWHRLAFDEVLQRTFPSGTPYP